MRKFAVPFLDVMTLLVLVLLLLVFAALMKISDAEDTTKSPTTSKLLITMQWGDKSRNDVDLWLKTPSENIIGFRNKQADFASLDHDNKGTEADNTAVDPNGNVIASDKRDEIMYVRSTIPGTYVVAIHLYSRIDGPDTVTVSLISIEPHYRVVTLRKLVLTTQREEQTAFRFTVDAGGAVTSTDIVPEEFVNRYLTGEL